MDVKQLEYVIEIAREKNITRAARKLHVSQSALSQFLAKLEQEVGAPLFVRLRSKLEPTPAGSMYLDAAREVIEIKKSLYRTIADDQTPVPVSIGISSQWGMDIFTRILPGIRAFSPVPALHIAEGSADQLISRLSEGELDFAIACIARPEVPSFETEVLYREELVLAVPSPWKEELSPELDREFPADGREALKRMNGLSFILPGEGTSIRSAADSLFVETQIVPHIVCEMNRMAGAVKLADGKMGLLLSRFPL